MPSFIPDLPVIAAFAVGALVLAITPGPDLALFLSRAIHYGRRHGLAALAGAVSGLLVHSLLAAFGISLLIATAPTAFWLLKIGGALYLIWLALQALRSGGGLTLAQAGRTMPTLRQSYLTGLGINLLNPKVILFFVTFLPQFVERSDPGAPGKLLFLGLVFIVVALPPVTVMILMAEKLARVLTSQKWVGKLLDYSFAAVFMTFAATLLLTEGRGR